MMIGMMCKAANAWATIKRWFKRAPSATRLAEERSTLARWLELGEMPGWRPEVAAEANAALVSAAPTRSTGKELAPLRWPVLSLALVVVAAWLWFAFGAAPASLVFDRHAISAGEWWRLTTGHWVHSDGNHALLDIVAIAVIAPLIEQAGRARLLAAVAVGTLAVDAWVWWGMPELVRYCGLSGLSNTLMVVALAGVRRHGGEPVLWLFAAGYLLKLVVEALTGDAVLTDTNWMAVPSAHVAGALSGLMLLGLEGLMKPTTGFGGRRPGVVTNMTFDGNIGSV